MTDRPMRSHHPHGSTRWATTRTQWRALGVTDDDLRKPRIAIVNSSSKLAPCFSHLDEIAVAVRESIAAAGGLGFEVRTVAPTDFIMAAGAGGGYVLSGRDLLSCDIEAVVQGAQLDAMVCLASCDKTTPGQLMAAGRIDIPTVIIPCGYQSCGAMDDGERVDIEEVFLHAPRVAAGTLALDDLCAMSDRAISSPGVCSGMGTANTMHIAAEALGMAPSGSAPVRANSDKMWEMVSRSGEIIMHAIKQDLRPRRIITDAALRNAVTAVLAVSGSINLVKHLQAVAVDAGTDVDVYRVFEELHGTVLPLSGIRPNGEHQIEDFEDAGGARALLAQLGDHVDHGALTITGSTVGENVEKVTVDETVIRPASDPMGARTTIVLLRGSLAPETAIVKLSVTESRRLTFEGPARVFEDAPSAIEALTAGAVQEGDVLVVRGLGPRGTPGMGMASQVVFTAAGVGLTEQIAIVTDGQLSGLVNKGIVMAEVSPEGALPGPLRAVRDGDTIRIDVDARTVDLDVAPEQIEQRLSEDPPTPDVPHGWLGVYAANVEPLHRGATLRPMSRQER